MAYCVHCGIKLEDSEKRCPLCSTEVFDPNEGKRVQAPSAYPTKTDKQILKSSRAFLLKLAAVLTLLPAVICLITNLLTEHAVTWSVYPATALSLMFFPFALPLLLKKHRFVFSYIFASCASIGYLYMIASIVHESWFFPTVLPLMLILSVILFIYITWLYKKRPGAFKGIAGALIIVGIFCLLLESLFALYLKNNALALIWSPYAAAPSIFFGIVMLIVSRKKDMMAELYRWTHC